MFKGPQSFTTLYYINVMSPLLTLHPAYCYTKSVVHELIFSDSSYTVLQSIQICDFSNPSTSLPNRIPRTAQSPYQYCLSTACMHAYCVHVTMSISLLKKIFNGGVFLRMPEVAHTSCIVPHGFWRLISKSKLLLFCVCFFADFFSGFARII